MATKDTLPEVGSLWHFPPWTNPNWLGPWRVVKVGRGSEGDEVVMLERVAGPPEGSYSGHYHEVGVGYWPTDWKPWTEQVGEETPRCEDGTIPTDDPSLIQAGVTRETCPGCPRCQSEQVGEGND